MATVRFQSFSQDRTDPWDANLKERYLYAFWHENLMSIMAVRSAAPTSILVSQSSDGELLSRACGYFGVNTIRGSSTRGGMEAVEDVLKIKGESHILVAPDGPRGPRREVKRGLAYLASWTGMGVVPLGIGFSRAWHAKSWDQTAIPKPFSKIVMVAGPVIRVPSVLNKRSSEEYRLLIEQTIGKANDIAVARSAGQDAAWDWPELRKAA